MKLRTGILSLAGIAVVVAHALAQQPGAPPRDEKMLPDATQPSGKELLAPISARLLRDFNRRLEDPQGYARDVKIRCASFPEGDLFPFLYPAMAYVNVALRAPDQRENSVRNCEKLIDLAIASVAQRVRPPQGELSRLISYQDHATYLGQLNLALGAFALISEDGRYDLLHRHLSDILYAALAKSNGRPLRSFPEHSWPFDTIPVLVSLKLYDRAASPTRSDAIIKEHLRWIREEGSDSNLQLPYSRIAVDANSSHELPRGCDLSFRLCLLPHLNRDYAKELYKFYTETYWLDRGLVAGFAEWPKGTQRFQDMDSGPIVMGIGLGATGLGVGATIALNDQERLRRLAGQLASMDVLRTRFLEAQGNTPDASTGELGKIALDNECFTGFLFGDVMLFYCVTWEEWPGEKRRE